MVLINLLQYVPAFIVFVKRLSIYTYWLGLQHIYWVECNPFITKDQGVLGLVAVQCPPSALLKKCSGPTMERCYKPSISPFYLLCVFYACVLDTLTCCLMFTVVPRKRGGSVLVATQTSLIFLDLKVRILSSFKFRKSPHFPHRSRDWKNSLGKKWISSTKKN